MQTHDIPCLQTRLPAALDDVDLAHRIFSKVVRPERRPHATYIRGHVRDVSHQERTRAESLLGLKTDGSPALGRCREDAGVVHAEVHLVC